MKKNCWEVKKCGREPGGINAEELGICPAATSSQFDNVNQGKFGGRFCWAIAGTLCENSIQGTYAQKLESCLRCDFFKIVNDEEDRSFILTPSKAEKAMKKKK